jgi:hypothetical protein
MAINFPLSPTLNEIYSYNGLSWQWNGSYWQSFPPSSGATGVVRTITASTGLSANTNTGDVTLIVTGSTGGGTFTGGTVTGATSFTGGLTATTISATTYFNLPTDVRVTGSTYSNNTFTFTNNTGGTFNVLFNTVTGLTVNGVLTVTGNTSLQALTATTISATTYQNLPFSGTVINSGTTTSNYIPKWTGTTALTNSQIRDDGTYVGIGITPSSPIKLWVYTNTLSYGIRGDGTIAGVYGQGVGFGTGVYGGASSSVGVQGSSVGDTGTNIGVYGSADINDSGTPTNIGGHFLAQNGGSNYSIQLQDGTEGTNKVLVSSTSDGKANWSSSLTGLTSVSATTYYNLPVSGLTQGSNITITNNGSGNFTIASTGGGGGGLSFQQVQMIAFLTS